MTSASKKRRRRKREREKRKEELLERARSISLVDIASPLPKKDRLSTEEGRQISTTESSDGLIRHRILKSDSTLDENPVSSPSTLPKEYSWKRVDFVLPRADGMKRFVFNRQNEAGKNDVSISLNGNNERATQNLKQGRKAETIEDILSAGKRQKEGFHENKCDYTLNQDEGSNKRARVNDDKNVISRSQLKNLTNADESVNEAESSLVFENCVDIPKIKKVNGDENTSTPKGNKSCDKFPLFTKIAKDTPESFDVQKLDKKLDHQKGKSRINVTQPSPGQISGRTVKEAVRDKRGLRPRANSTDGELNLPRGGLCDERMILEAHKWNTEKKFINQSQPRGFHNLGNTCFLNATLQCLTYLPPLCQTLISISNNKGDDGNNGRKRKIPQGQRITASLQNLFQQAHGVNKTSSNIQGPFSPKKIVNHLPNIGSCGSRNGYKFRLGRQEDAHEFLVHLLDAMNDGELRAAGINQTVSGWRDRLPVSRLDETTFVHRIFGGYFRSQVRCGRCNYKSNTYDPFLDLSLEVSKKSSTSVLRALSEFTRKETLDAANRWKCSGCKKYVCATKQLTVFRPPLSLCIQLKRFAFDNNFGFSQKFSKYHYAGGGGGSKITKPIEFPGTLQLPLSDNRSCQYTLTGIVIHVGGSSQSGHYTAYVKKPGKNGANQWYHMDDSHVQPVSEKTVLKQKDAYLLFYCRTEVKLEFPDPPSRSMSASEAAEFGRTRAMARANSFPSERLKKDLKRQAQIDTDEDEAIAPVETSSQKVLRSQQKVDVPSGKKNKNDLVDKLNGMIHTLRDSSRSPQKSDNTTSTSLPSATSFVNGGTTSSSSSSSNVKIFKEHQSCEHDRKRKDKKADTIPQNNSDTSSNDSSYSQSSSNTGASSDSYSSVERENSEDSVNGGDKLSVYSIDESARSSASEIGNSTKTYSNSQGKFSDQKIRKHIDSYKQNELAEDVVRKGKSYLYDENKTPKDNRKERDSSIRSKDKAECSSKNEVESEDKTLPIDNQHDSDDNRIQSEKKPEQITTNTTLKITQVVQNNTDTRGKVKVILEPRKGKPWKSISSTIPSKEPDFQLLGNMKVSRWGDEDIDDKNDAPATLENQRSECSAHLKREKIVDKIEKQSRSRKRKMHLDRWDSYLDQGKLKKVKSASNATSHETTSKSTKRNVFQRIQSGVQRMSRGKPKGFIRRKFKNRKGKF